MKHFGFTFIFQTFTYLLSIQAKGSFVFEMHHLDSKWKGVICIYPTPPLTKRWRVCFQKQFLILLCLIACAQFDQPEVRHLMPPAPAEVHEIYSSSYTQVKFRML